MPQKASSLTKWSKVHLLHFYGVLEEALHHYSDDWTSSTCNCKCVCYPRLASKKVTCHLPSLVLLNAVICEYHFLWTPKYTLRFYFSFSPAISSAARSRPESSQRACKLSLPFVDAPIRSTLHTTMGIIFWFCLGVLTVFLRQGFMYSK